MSVIGQYLRRHLVSRLSSPGVLGVLGVLQVRASGIAGVEGGAYVEGIVFVIAVAGDPKLKNKNSAG